MKAFKTEILIIDFDELGKDGILEELENANFPNDCLSLDVQSIEEKDIGEWSDDHPLNNISTSRAECKRLFAKNLDFASLVAKWEIAAEERRKVATECRKRGEIEEALPLENSANAYSRCALELEEMVIKIDGAK